MATPIIPPSLLIGRRVGSLVVLELGEPRIYGNRRRRRWWCLCDCGRRVLVDQVRLVPRSNCAIQTCGQHRMTTMERVLAHIHKPDGDSGCWVWTGCLNPDGYAYLGKAVDGRSIRVVRWLYRQLRGEFDPELTIDHLCRNRACVNPWHLEPVTQRENTLRGNSPAAQNARKTHCKRGHEFTPENTYASRSSRRERVCRTCAREATRERRRRERDG